MKVLICSLKLKKENTIVFLFYLLPIKFQIQLKLEKALRQIVNLIKIQFQVTSLKHCGPEVKLKTSFKYIVLYNS